jgi:hypothetical protein
MIAALAAFALLVPQQDNDALKKKILQDVEKRLKSQDDRLLKDIERVIEEELHRPAAGAPAARQDVAPKADGPRKGRGYMGVRPGDLTDAEKAALKIKSGIKVVEVVEGGPGEKAGLKKDDVITAIDGRAIDSPQDVPGIVQAAGAGSKLKIDLLRGGEKKSLEVTLGKHPLDEQQGKAEPPKEGDLRERLKKFKEAEPRQDPPKAPAPKPKKAEPKQDEPGEEDDLFAFDDTMMEQFRGLFEQFGMDPEQFFDQGKDGKYRFKKDWNQLFKGMEKFFKDLPRGLPGLQPEEDPEPEPEPAPKKPAAKAPKAPAAPKVWMGFLGEEVGDDLRTQLDLEGGVLVTDVSPGGPAEKAGLKKSDVILKMDGKAVKGPDDLAGVMSGAKAGQEMTLVVLRKGKEQTLKVTLAERKE